MKTEENEVFSSTSARQASQPPELDSGLPFIPPEILQIIFSHIIAPRLLLDTSLFTQRAKASSYKLSHRMKISLSQVCRGWNAIATDLLYKEVYLWDFPQVLAFGHTLENSPRQLGPFVTFLSIECLIPVLDWRVCTNLLATLHRVCSMCPNLQILSFDPIQDADKNVLLPFFDIPPTLTISTCLFSGNACLQELSLSSDMLQYLNRDIATGISRTLETLSIILGSLEPIVALDWPRLKWLRCKLQLQCCSEHGRCTESSECFSPRSFKLVADLWSMPCLHKLSLSAASQWKQNLYTCFPLIEKYQDQVSYLCLFNFYRGSEGSCVVRLLEKAPRLQHLVLSETLGFTPNVSHSVLEYLDIWGEWTRTRTLAYWELSNDPESMSVVDDREKFPSLKNVRFFDMGLSSTVSGSDLPLLIPPDVFPLHFDAEIRYLGVDIRVSGGKVAFRNDLSRMDSCLEGSTLFRLHPRDNREGVSSHLGCFEAWPAFNDESDSDYLPDSDSEQSTSDGGSDDDWEYRSEYSAADSLYDEIANVANGQS
ncbi:hypothetical protein V5O48_007087 [Marasmius crinis-equi]|uniref:F-box domain-containing protein n=1 Tax=Marasmius crinis-equi TaxID=585013 RepID=A0ABR3FIF6_9AGAR